MKFILIDSEMKSNLQSLLSVLYAIMSVLSQRKRAFPINPDNMEKEFAEILQNYLVRSVDDTGIILTIYSID